MDSTSPTSRGSHRKVHQVYCACVGSDRRLAGWGFDWLPRWLAAGPRWKSTDDLLVARPCEPHKTRATRHTSVILLLPSLKLLLPQLQWWWRRWWWWQYHMLLLLGYNRRWWLASSINACSSTARLTWHWSLALVAPRGSLVFFLLRLRRPSARTFVTIGFVYCRHCYSVYSKLRKFAQKIRLSHVRI